MLARRRLRWWWWPCAFGLVFTIALAVFSEYNLVSYREPSNTGLSDSFLLSRSGISARFYTHKTGMILTGIDMFRDGWTMPTRYFSNFVPRVWLPRVWLISWPSSPVQYWDIAIPLWLPAVLFAVPTFLGWRAARPRDPAQCTACGYDRRGLPSTAPCPECGRAA